MGSQMPHNLLFGLPNRLTFIISIGIAGVALAILGVALRSQRSRMLPRMRAVASSGWLPASILAACATVVLAAYDTPLPQVAIFGAYVTVGIALPGMLWVRLLHGRAAHISEDLTLGLAVGYCVEIATYIAARAVGAPLLFVLWPISTLVVFTAVPALRQHWRGGGTQAPIWWSWSLAVMLGYLLVYSAGTFFSVHHLAGTDTPYVDSPYHLALIGELVHHVPPELPFLSGVPLDYHWFFYAEAAATSWATGIEPLTLLYRLSALPMFVVFVVLTAATAQRITNRWLSGPIAVAVALFGTVAGPYRWVGSAVFNPQGWNVPVFDTQTLSLTWISPTNLFGLALFAAAVLCFIDLVRADTSVSRRQCLLIAVLVFGAAGAKASLLPLLIVGLLTVIVGTAIIRRRVHRSSVAGLIMAGGGLLLATGLLYGGKTRGLVVGLDSLRSFPVVGLTGAADAQGISNFVMPFFGLLIAIVLWSFLWSGMCGLLAPGQGSSPYPAILLLLGICAGALGAVTVFSYPSVSQLYYLTPAAGVFGVLATVGISRVVPARTHYLPLLVCVCIAAAVGAAAVLAVAAIGPASAPTLVTAHLSGVLPVIILPILALIGIVVTAYIALRSVALRSRVVSGAVPLLVIALAMGFSLPNVAKVLATPINGKSLTGVTIPGDGISAARWLRDHSGPDDLVATNLHCAWYTTDYGSCNKVSYWVAAYSERRVLVEGGWGDGSFWDPALLAANDSAFTNPSVAAEATLRDQYGVRWLLADLAGANADAVGRYADLRYREGDFAVYELLGP
jgi:hypothetical protein